MIIQRNPKNRISSIADVIWYVDDNFDDVRRNDTIAPTDQIHSNSERRKQLKKVKLYYFTGSGNTLKIAEKTEEIFKKMKYECSVEKMESALPVNIDPYEYTGLIFPVAVQSTFPLVWNFINSLPPVKEKKIFMIDTMEQFSGGIVGPVKKVLLEKGYDCAAALEVKMISSIHIKKADSKALRIKNTRALKDTETFITEMLDGKRRWPRVPFLSDWMRNISVKRGIWTETSKKIDISHEKCIKCQICLRNCPVKAINFIHNKIVINHEICNVCVRCIHNCPEDAFTYNGKQVFRLDH